MFASCKNHLSRYSCGSLVPLGMKWACICAGKSAWCGVVCCCCVCRWLCGVVACLLLRGGLSSDVETSLGNLSEGHGSSQKKKNRNHEGSLSTCDQQFIVNCQEHNRGWKGSASVFASMRWLSSCVKKKCYVFDGSKLKKRYL